MATLTVVILNIKFRLAQNERIRIYRSVLPMRGCVPKRLRTGASLATWRDSLVLGGSIRPHGWGSSGNCLSCGGARGPPRWCHRIQPTGHVLLLFCLPDAPSALEAVPQLPLH